MALHLLAVALQSLARLDHSADCVRHLFVFPSLRVLNKTRRQSNCPYEIDTIKKNSPTRGIRRPLLGVLAPRVGIRGKVVNEAR